MRILIICSSLEKGKDGVGDYSLKLGNWLGRHSCDVQIIAVNDKHLSEGENRDGVISRMSSHLKLSARQKILQEKIDDFRPEIIFLQYVPYAYHKKGIPLKFARMIGSLKTSGEWIIMVHEPYIGGRLTAKGKFVQFAQKKALKILVNKTAPKRVYTSIRKYQKALSDIHIVSSILPLFGNIELADFDDLTKEKSKIQKGLYFGAPPARDHFHIIKDDLIEAASTNPLHITVCGKTNNSEFAKYLEYSFKDEGIEVENIGELPELELSQLFSRADFGIARVSPDLIGKSGSAISLLEHGLKLWIPLAHSEAEIQKEVVFRPGICFSSLSELMADTSQPEKISNLDKVGKLLMSQIGTFS